MSVHNEDSGLLVAHKVAKIRSGVGVLAFWLFYFGNNVWLRYREPTLLVKLVKSRPKTFLFHKAYS